MKKIILLIVLCAMMGGVTRGQKFQWIHPYVSCTSAGYDITYDNQDALYICGWIRPSNFTFDSLTVPWYGYEDGFVAKTDTTGKIQWINSIGSGISQEKTNKIILHKNKIYAYGWLGNSPGSYLICYDTSGTTNWNISNYNILDFTIDSTDNVYFSSYAYGKIYLYKANPSGDVIDSLGLFIPNNQFYGNKIIYDNSGNLIFTQSFSDTIVFLGTTYFTSQSNLSDYLVLKCDTDFNVVAVKRLSGAGQDFVFDQIINNDGELTIVSQWKGTVIYDGNSYPGTGARVVLSTLDSALNIISNTFLNLHQTSSIQVMQNDMNEYYLAINQLITGGSGSFYIIGQDTIFSNPAYSATVGILAKYNSARQLTWYRAVANDTSAVHTTGTASIKLSRSSNNKIYVTGTFYGATIIDTTFYGNAWGAYTGLLIDTTYGLNCSIAPTSITSNATNNIICSNQSVTLTQVGGVLSANGVFHWYADSCGGTSLGTGYSKTFSPIDTITYYVRAEDSCGVTACSSITINVNPSPNVSISGLTSFCLGDSTVLTASGGTSYLWSTGAVTQSVILSVGGPYTVTVTNSYGCSASAVVVINATNPTPVITGITTICAGNSTSLDAGSLYTNYLWSIAATTQTINVSTAGTYTVTVTDANGCTGSASATVSVHPLPTAVLSGNASICIGDCASLTVSFTGTQPFGFSYTDGVATFGPFVTSVNPIVINVCPLVTTTYTLVSVFDLYCTGTVSGVATVTVNPIPVPVITGFTNLCQGNTTVLNAGAGYASYAWSTWSNTQTITTGTGGIYTVTVTDANGCVGSTSVTVTAVPNPVAVINPSVTTYFCQGDTVHFTANTGTGFIYQWYKNGVPQNGAVNSFYNAVATGNYWFALTDSNGCDSLSTSTFAQIICFPMDTNISQRTGSLPGNDIVLLPNPAHNELTIKTVSALQSIKIFDVIGQQVFSKYLPADNPTKDGFDKANRHPDNYLETIDIHTFSNGIYFVEVTNGKEKEVKKFVKE